jgi:hypothetical protein
MIVTIVTTIPRWRREKPARSILLIISLCVGKNESTLATNTVMRFFYLAYCFYGQKIDVEKTARTIVTQMNDDSNII